MRPIILTFLLSTKIHCQFPHQFANSLIFKRYLLISNEFELNQSISPMFYFRNCAGNEFDLRPTDFIDERIAQKIKFEKNPELLNVFNASFVGKDFTSLSFILEDRLDESTRKLSEFHARFFRDQIPNDGSFYSPEQGWIIERENEICKCF